MANNLLCQCTAKSSRTHERCKANAVRGKRVCYHHGGAPRSGRPIVSGRYSKPLANHPAVQAYYEEYKTDPNLNETLNEIALLRAKLAFYLETHAEDDGKQVMQAVHDYADGISQLAERRHKIMYGERITITQRDFNSMATRVIEIVKDVYGENEQFTRFLAALSVVYDPRRDSAVPDPAGGYSPI